MEVQVFDGNLDRAIRALRRRLKADGILQQIKDRDRLGYAKPSERRRRKDRVALRRKRQAERHARWRR